MAYSLGIDLGATVTTAAIVRDGQAQIVALGTRSASIPTLLYLRDDGAVMVGDAADRRGGADPARLAREFKGRIGNPESLIVGGTPWAAEGLMARVYRFVYDAVVAQEGGPPTRTVLTYPATWKAYKTDLLRQAVRLADLDHDVPVHLVPEPVAAAFQLSATTSFAPGDLIAFYDLGGANFDAAVVRGTEGGFEVVGEPETIEQVGGANVDSTIYAHVAANVGDALARLDSSDPVSMAAASQLRQACADAKEALSSDTDAVIPVALPNSYTDVRLTRRELEEMIRPAVELTVEAMRRVIESAGTTPAALRAVMMTGGGSHIPLVAELVGNGLGVPVAIGSHPQHVIAVGAAIAAWRASQAAPAPHAPTPLPAKPPAPAPPPPPSPPTAMAAAPDPVPAAPTWDPAAATRAEPVYVPPEPYIPPPGTGEPPPITPSPPPAPPSRRKLLLPIGLVVLLAAGAIAYFLTRPDDSGGNGPNTTAAAGATTAPPTIDGGGPEPVASIIFERDDATGDGSIWVMNADGTDQRPIIDTDGSDELPTLSADRTRLAWVHADAPGAPTYSVMVGNADGTGGRIVADGLTKFFRPALSPDGSIVVFPLPQPDGQSDLFTVPFEGGTPTRLTNTPESEHDPAWSPDGQTIAYRSEGDDNEVFVMNADGTNPRNLSSNVGLDTDPSFSPDGTQLSFTSDRSGELEIYVMNADGSDVRNVTNSDGLDLDGVWLSDNRIVFESDRAGDLDVFIMNHDGTNVVQLTANPGTDWIPA